MHIKILIRLYILQYLINNAVSEEFLSDYCKKIEGTKHCKSEQSHFSKKRYILYDVNPAEGFNLRRDVYIRLATFMKKLVEENKEYDWNLVLPPWGNLYHWKSEDIGSQVGITWGIFFDMTSLKRYIPVLEMYEFLKEFPSEDKQTQLDIVYYIRNDEEMFKTGNFKDKNIIIECPENEIPYRNHGSKRIFGSFWNYNNITARQLKCVIFHGSILNLQMNLHPTLYRTVMFDHMEIPLHFTYGSGEFWRARRSMRYNPNLYQIANEFRLIYLNSNDLDDNTQKPDDWRLGKKQRNAVGGPYLAIHFRRQDFIIGRASTVPTVNSAASQMKEILKLFNLQTVFIASDTDDREYNRLKKELDGYAVFRFIPTKEIKQKYKDGGVAIIDQIICSHARYFIGTHESTFTFRIQEDREILGFPSNTTFNRFCGQDNDCSPGSKWEIVWI